MSLVESYHAAHKARLARLSPAPKPPKPETAWHPPAVEYLAFDAGWQDMWFHDLISMRIYKSDNFSVKDIQTAVAEYFGVSVHDILAHRRTANVVLPRHVGMYLTKKLTHRTLPEIGRLFGRRDHTTVLHACRKIEALVETDSRLFAAITQIRRRFV